MLKCQESFLDTFIDENNLLKLNQHLANVTVLVVCLLLQKFRVPATAWRCRPSTNPRQRVFVSARRSHTRPDCSSNILNHCQAEQQRLYRFTAVFLLGLNSTLQN